MRAARCAASRRPGRRRRTGPATAAPPTPARRGPAATAPAPCRAGRRGPRRGSGSWRACRSPPAARPGRATIAIPQSYGTLSVLCASVRPRVGRSRSPATRCRSRGEAAAHSPNAPSTCTQAPCVVRQLDRLGERVERPGVQVAGLQADDQSARRPSASAAARASGRIRPCSSAGDRGRRAEPEVAQRQVDGVVPLRADEHAHPRRAGQAVAGRGPSRPRVSTCCRPAARPVKLAIVPPVTKPTSAVGRQAQQVEQPARRRPPRPPVVAGRRRSACRCSGPRR